MYRRGPRTDPWGRPEGAGTQEDLDSPWTTHMERSLRKEDSHESRVPETPKDQSGRKYPIVPGEFGWPEGNCPWGKVSEGESVQQGNCLAFTCLNVPSYIHVTYIHMCRWNKLLIAHFTC